MSIKKLNHYQGRLTLGQIAEGINAASRNARRVVEDAVLLLTNKRFPSAASLAISSIGGGGEGQGSLWVESGNGDMDAGDCAAIRGGASAIAMAIRKGERGK